jgi:hypothetical protein
MAVAVELIAGGRHIVFDGHRLAAADDLDQVVGAGEHTVLIILRDVAEVLHQKRCGALSGQRRREGRDVDGFVSGRDAQRLSDFLRDLIVVEFLGPDQGIDLAVVRIGVLQNRGDDVGLVAADDGCVAAVAERKPKNIFIFPA